MEVHSFQIALVLHQLAVREHWKSLSMLVTEFLLVPAFVVFVNFGNFLHSGQDLLDLFDFFKMTPVIEELLIHFFVFVLSKWSILPRVRVLDASDEV